MLGTFLDRWVSNLIPKKQKLGISINFYGHLDWNQNNHCTSILRLVSVGVGEKCVEGARDLEQ